MNKRHLHWIILCLAWALLLFTFCAPTVQKELGIPAQWKASAHALSGDTSEEMISMNRTECAHCHTAQGYWEVILEGKPSSAPYEGVTGLTCIACHMEGTVKGAVGQLRATRVQDACTGCHTILVESSATNLEWCPQVAMLNGHETETLDAEGPHSHLEKHCVSCHMAPASEDLDNTVAGGHTFRVMTKGSQPPVLNATGCVACHKEATVEWVEAYQTTIRMKLHALAELLPCQDKPETGTQPAEPRFPEDPALTRPQSNASFNYWMVVKDGTLGVHNPVYTKKLLDDALALMQNENR